MNMIDLSAAGLSVTEAKCYQALLERPAWKPADLARTVHETRTNCYKILEKLMGFRLAERFDKDKKLHYKAVNPSQLFELARQQRIARDQSEKQLELQATELMRQFAQTNEQPGIRYFQGLEDTKKIFTEVAAAKTEVSMVHTLAGIDFYGFTAMHNLRMLAPLAGVHRRVLAQDGPRAARDYKMNDGRVLIERTWLRQDDYTASVEWGAFDDKLYLISYGTEAVGVIIENQAIAEAFKQLLRLIERGQKLLPDYDELPKQARAKSGKPVILPED